MRRLSPVHALSALLAVAMACRGKHDATGPATAAPVPSSTVIQTDSAAYTMQDVGPASGWSFELGMIYTNTGSTPVQFSMCPGMLPPDLQRWNGFEWVTEWQPIQVACSAPLFTLAPGGTHRQVVFVWGASATTKFIPAWHDVDPSGTYRAVWNLQRVSGTGGAGLPVPIEERVSNNFTLRIPKE